MTSNLPEVIGSLREQAGLPALAACAIVNGQPQPAIVCGTRISGGTVPVQADDAFHLGSCTKAMTATLAGLLVDAGKLAFRQPIAEALPDIRRHPDWRSVTVAHLIAHRSGMTTRNYPKGASLEYVHRLPGSHREQRTRFVREMLAEPPAFGLGTFHYSNSNYAVLGAILERAASDDWETLMRERVWKPLGITTGGFGPPPVIGQHERKANGPLRVVSPGPLADNPPALGPAGTVHLSLGDWAKFAALHANSDQLLRPETFRFLHTSPFRGGHYGGGWLLEPRPWAAGTALTHGGSNTMNYAIVWVAPQRRFAALAATNAPGDVAQTTCDLVIQRLIQHFVP